jgi:hypothetical protein
MKSLIVKGGVKLIALKDFRVLSDRNKTKKRVHANKGSQPIRHYRRYSEAGNNLRMYKQDVETVSK